MACGANMKVSTTNIYMLYLPWQLYSHLVLQHHLQFYLSIVDYILFIKADVDLNINPNEVQSYKYVSKDELKEMIATAGKRELSTS